MRFPGFLLVEVTIAILMSILLSSVIVVYHGRAAQARAQARVRAQLLARALEAMELGLAGIRTQESLYPIPVSKPLIEGLSVVIPDLSPAVCVRIHDEQGATLMLTSWIGTGS